MRQSSARVTEMGNSYGDHPDYAVGREIYRRAFLERAKTYREKNKLDRAKVLAAAQTDPAKRKAALAEAESCAKEVVWSLYEVERLSDLFHGRNQPEPE